MATLDIFNNDAFSLSALSQVIVDIPRVPTQIGDEGLFQEYGINSLTMMIERQGAALKLVPTAPRGGIPEPVSLTGRKLIPVASVHMPQSGAIMADEVQGVRAFGTESEVDSVMNLITRKTTVMKNNLDLTLEYQRMGAIKGQVLDADGSTVLWDMYSIFGFTQQTIFFDLSNAATDIKQKCIDLKRAIQLKMGGRSITGVKVKVSAGFFDKLIAHAKVLKAYDLWQTGQFLRETQVDGEFNFCGITFQPYIGGTSSGDFIADGLGYAYPVGVPGMFQTAYSPANFMETVNTQGLPYYLKQSIMKYDVGVELYSQSNPLHLNTLPEATIKVSAAAS